MTPPTRPPTGDGPPNRCCDVALRARIAAIRCRARVCRERLELTRNAMLHRPGRPFGRPSREAITGVPVRSLTSGADHACLVRGGVGGLSADLENPIGIVRGKYQKFNIRGPGTTLFDPGFGFLASRCKFSTMKRPNRTNMDPFPAIFSHFGPQFKVFG